MTNQETTTNVLILHFACVIGHHVVAETSGSLDKMNHKVGIWGSPAQLTESQAWSLGYGSTMG